MKIFVIIFIIVSALFSLSIIGYVIADIAIEKKNFNKQKKKL